MGMSGPQNNKRLTKLEAALYAAGRPVDMESMKVVVRTKSDKVIARLIQELSLRYEARGSALEVKVLPGNRTVMRLKQKYDQSVKRFTTRPLLSSGPLRTLSYVAYHQPVLQSQVVDDRGNHVYAHMKRLEDMGLITRERNKNRAYMIETTPFFADYFGFGTDPSNTRIQLRRIFNQMKIHRLENGEEESAEENALDLVFNGSTLTESIDKLP
jgi:segregation and condensation protein B